MGFEIISKAATAATATLGTAQDHPVRTAALQLRPGESFVVENKDWNWKYAGLELLVRRQNKNPHYPGGRQAN